MMPSSKDKIRYGVVGMGWFAQAAVLPAFAHAADNSELAALVSGDPEKARELSDRYKVPGFRYEEFDDLAASGKIDAVYIVLPNALHREYTERAARAGVHVLCEKPMAHRVKDCKAMLKVCTKNDVKLMIAYRLHFEEGNLEAIRLLESGAIGEPRVFHSILTQQVQEENRTRTDDDLGGGPLLDVGIYCVNAARYLFRAEPTEVLAFAGARDQERFDEVPEMVSGLLRFPGERLASFTCGFGEAKVSAYRVIGTRGDLRVDPAYTFHGDIKHYLTADGKTQERTFSQRDQIAAELLYFSDCVLRDREPEPSGLEGLIDVEILEALEQSCRKGKVVKLGSFAAKPRPVPGQAIERPPVSKQDLVNAAEPSGGT
jgi:glucose-fructose oxidoreductase